ncbi:hypothetical protein LR48_Vigan02g107800 [Vigna angularis]|uniref:Putative plant transposon protein domain-containing protein n=1 Tax=Phaseolus angularis TaxID=3914 RepID=A0A0L9TWG2_PHAAN|nr:hypothetical protein LR48_Vigan02g107800 [Vigna angularis]
MMERKAGMIPNFAPQFGEQLMGRNLRRLATYLAPANITVVKEFYTNTRRLGDYPAEDYLSYVRGHAIRYDRDSINNFLGTEWVGVCQHDEQQGTFTTSFLDYAPMQDAGVDTSTPPFERPRKAIDEAYYRQYCGGEEAAQPVPPRRPRRERGPAQSQASTKTYEAKPFQMRDIYMSLIGAQMQSIHRG